MPCMTQVVLLSKTENNLWGYKRLKSTRSTIKTEHRQWEKPLICVKGEAPLTSRKSSTEVSLTQTDWNKIDFERTWISWNISQQKEPTHFQCILKPCKHGSCLRWVAASCIQHLGPSWCRADRSLVRHLGCSLLHHSDSSIGDGDMNLNSKVLSCLALKTKLKVLFSSCTFQSHVWSWLLVNNLCKKRFNSKMAAMKSASPCTPSSTNLKGPANGVPFFLK